MTSIPFVLTLFSLLCAALSLVTRILFRPKTFFPPANRLSHIISFVYLLSFATFFVASKMQWFPIWSSSDWLSFSTNGMVAMTYSQAIWHHIETATRTPQDLWAKFFHG